MGYALALMAKRRGASVTLISGPTALPVPRGVDFVPIKTALEMRDAVLDRLEGSTVVIKAAAVADYRPERFQKKKIKKKAGPLNLNLERNPDILAEIGKLMTKGMDFIVANDLTEAGAGFQTDTNIIRILDWEGGDERFPLMDKREVAGIILDRVKKVRESGRIR
jgi:phosphopantothenoylcysteine decarboxylase/phosphopantothenate--cysteine ligase